MEKSRQACMFVIGAVGAGAAIRRIFAREMQSKIHGIDGRVNMLGLGLIFFAHMRMCRTGYRHPSERRTRRSNAMLTDQEQKAIEIAAYGKLIRFHTRHHWILTWIEEQPGKNLADKLWNVVNRAYQADYA